MTADACIKHQSYKQCNISTDPLADILNNIDKNPGEYTSKQVLNSVAEEEQSIGQTVNIPNQQVAENIEHSTKRTGINKREGTDELRGNILTRHEGEITRTRSGCTIKNGQINIHINTAVSPADMLDTSTNVIQPTALFHNSKHFCMTFFVGHQPANIANCNA